MRVLICGGRDFHDELALDTALDAMFLPRGTTLIVGTAPGADTLAESYGLMNGMQVERYPADWRKHGKAAGPIRNQRMLDEGKPALVIAFPGGRGTADMVGRARAAGLPVKEVSA